MSAEFDPHHQLTPGPLLHPAEHPGEVVPAHGVLVEELVAEVGVLDAAHGRVGAAQRELARGLAPAAGLRVGVEQEGHHVPTHMERKEKRIHLKKVRVSAYVQQTLFLLRLATGRGK